MQRRARASLGRMIEAVERVLAERGADAFTLAEVSRVGGVSVGSIYHRFLGNEDLLRAVRRQQMAVLRAEHEAIAARAARLARDLPCLLRVLIGEIADFLVRSAPMLEALMSFAANDPVIAREGSKTYRHLRDLFVAAVMPYRETITRPDAERAAGTCLDVAYSVFARELGLDAPHSGRSERDWAVLKADLSDMCIAFPTIDRPATAALAKLARRRSASP